MPTDIGPRIGVQGEREFRASIAQIDSSLKTMGAEMKLVTAQYDDNAKSMEALTKKGDILQKQNDALNSKLAEQQARLQQLKDAGLGPADKSYAELERSIIRTETELAKNESAIRKNDAAMKEASSSGDKFAGVLKALEGGAKVAAASIAALGAATAAAVGTVAKLTVDAAYAADEINTLSKTTGLSTTEIQRFQFASEQIDVSLDTLTGSMTKMTRNMETASKGSGDAYEAFKQLGVEITNQDGSLRDRNEVFNETIKALGGVEDAQKRDLIAMKVFGKSAQDLNPLIMGGVDALQELGDKAEAAGLILDQTALDKLNTVSDAMDTFKATTEGAGRMMVVGFAEPMAQAVDTATGYIMQLTTAFSKGGFDALSKELGTVLTSLSQDIVDYLPEVVTFGTQIVESLATGLISMLPSIMDSASQIILTLATSLAGMLPDLIPVAVDAILTLVDTMVSNVTQMVDAAVAIIMALADGLIAALPVLIEKAPEIVGHLVDAIVQAAPQLLTAAIQLLVTLGGAIISNLPRLGEACFKIVGKIVDGIRSLKERIQSIGKDIVLGIWQGISSMVSWFTDKVKGFFSGIVNGVKNTLGIHSPSTVFAGIGENMGKGLGVGFESSMEDVRRQMQAAMPGLEGAVSVNAAGGPIQSGGSGADLAAAVAAALNNAAVYMDQHKVGRLITIDQQSAARRGLIRV